MKVRFFLVFFMAILAFCLLLILPVCKKINSERRLLSVINSTIHKEKISDQDFVEKISRMAGLIGVDAEVSVSNESGVSQPRVHVRAFGDYQQLVKLTMTLAEKSRNVFILSLSMLAMGSQEDGPGLEMDATFGVCL